MPEQTSIVEPSPIPLVDTITATSGLVASSIDAELIPVEPEEAETQPANDSKSLEENEAPPVRQPLSRGREYAIIAIAMLTMSLSSSGNVALNISLPQIQSDLDMSESTLQWVSSAFSLTNGCFLLLSGRLADVHGRKLIFLCGLSWYAIWSLIGGFMHSAAALVVTRALTGAGAAMSIPSVIGIIASNFQGPSRATAFACFSAGAPIGGGVGLVLGGVMNSYTEPKWRAALYILAGLAAVATSLAALIVPTDIVDERDRRVDWIGAALVTVGLIFVQFAISDGEGAPNGWKTSYVIALLIIGVLCVAAFFFWENHVIKNTTRPPLMRLALWTRAKGRLAATYFIGFVSWMGFVSLFYYATLYYQQVQDTGSVGAMLRFLPTTVSGIICNVVVAYLVHKIPTQMLICVGIAATALANIFFAISPKDELYWRFPFNAMWLAVLGADFLMATGSIFVSVLALPEEQSVAGALFQTLVQLGGAFGLSLTSVIQTVYYAKGLASGQQETDALLQGIHAAFFLAASFSIAALIISLIALRGLGIITKHKNEREEPETAELEMKKS